MSRFRAINRPTESPLKPTTGERPLSDVRRSSEPEGSWTSALSPMQAASATPDADKRKRQRSPKVVLPAKGLTVSPNDHRSQPVQSSTSRPSDKQSQGLSEEKGDIRQAVAKAKLHAQNNKKRKSECTVSKARRQQARREAKLVTSIEHSARGSIASSSPDYGTDETKDSDYHPSPAELADMNLSSASTTPSRKRPRKRPSTRPNAESSAISGSTLDFSSSKSSPQAGGTLAAIERELPSAPPSSPNLEPAVTPIPPSPSIWNPQLRRKRYEEAEFVELPKEVFEYKKTKKEMVVKKEVMKAGKRREKGKLAEPRSVETCESAQEADKRKAEDEPNELRKRRKSHKLQKPGLEHHPSTDDGKGCSGKTQTSKQISAQEFPKATTTDKQARRQKAVVVKAGDRSDMSDVRSHTGIEARGHSSEGSKNKKGQHSSEMQAPQERSGQSDDQALRHRERQRRSLNEDWRKPYGRREVPVPEIPRSCTCTLLPDYFTSNPSDVPCLGNWSGCELEFYKHVKQIRSCRGSIHPPHVVDACRTMLEKTDFAQRCDGDPSESAFRFAQGVLSTDDQNDHTLRRAQSSIPPPVFYGNGGRYQPTPNAGRSTHSAPEMNKVPPSLDPRSNPRKVERPKKVFNRSSPWKALPMRDRTKNVASHVASTAGRSSRPAVVDNSSQYLTPPNSSLLGKRRRADVPGRPRVLDGPSFGEGNAGVEQISKTLPEASSGRPKPQASFCAQRKCHQSVPVYLDRSDNAVYEDALSPRPTQRRHEDALQEMSKNVILMNTAVASMRKTLDELDERLPATTTTHNGLVEPAPASAPAPPPPPQQPHVRKRRKRPTRAELKLKYPELSREVPSHLRLSDPELIEVGRIVNHYERHKGAPEAFTWSGHLYKDYYRLLTMSDQEDRPLWTAEEILRVVRG